MVKKIGNSKVVAPNGRGESLKPFEDNFHLVTFLQYRDRGVEVGATLLQKPNQESYRVVFGFQCQGIAPIITEEELLNVVGGFQAFNDISPGEALTTHFGLFIDDRARQAQLEELMKAATPELKLLLGSTAKRVRELTQAGIRKNLFCHLYATYTVEEGVESGSGDIFDRLLAALEKGWYQINGAYEEVKKVALEEILVEAYLRGYNRWRRLLANQVGLGIEPMNLSQMVKAQWQRFNTTDTPPRPLAHVTIDLDKKRDRCTETSTTIHPKAYLLSSGVPIPERDNVQVKGQWTGAIILADKPDLPSDDPATSLYYLWDILSKENLYDLEVFTQIRRASNKLLKDKMSSLTKQAQKTAEYAAETGNIDVGATVAIEKAVEAQRALYEDSEPFKTGTVVLIHRPTQVDLNRACTEFTSLFRRSGWAVREDQYAHRVWLETFPALIWSSLLAKPFERRRTYVTSELPRILPLVCNRSLASEGFELLASEGGSPIFLDLYQRPQHLGVFGTSGSGKTMLLCDLLVQALPYQIPSTILDFPRDDGTGSFDGLADYLTDDCSYADTGALEGGLNMMEPPDLRGFPAKAQKERLSQSTENTLDLLVGMVMGFQKKALDINEDTVRSILLLALESFYSDPEIIEAFGNAFQRGFGSPEWRTMPTYSDFIPFCSLERLQLPNATGEILRTLDYLKLRLRYWQESRLGKYLSRPSSFRADTPILILSLRGLNNETDAALIGSLAYNRAISRSLSYSDSIFLADEANILTDHDPLALALGRLYAVGRKSGIRAILAGQGLGSLLGCAAADKIFDNMSVKITGKVLPQSVDTYAQYFKYPYDLIVSHAAEKFGVHAAERYSQWLYDAGRLIPVRHYPSAALFALVANNRAEASKRQAFWAKYQGDPVRGLYELTQQFAA